MKAGGNKNKTYYWAYVEGKRKKGELVKQVDNQILLKFNDGYLQWYSVRHVELAELQ